MKNLLVSILVGSMIASLVFAGVALATTIGTNISTSGTFTVQSTSATSAQFQDAGGTNTLMTIDTTNMRVGINHGVAIDTRFEVGGTASAANLLTTGGLQVAGGASVAYSRFGTAATTSHGLSATSDALYTGFAEFDKRVYFDSTASAAYFLSPNAVQFGSSTASVAYNRFGSTTTSHSNFISAASDLLVSGDVEIRASLSVSGTASISGVLLLDEGLVRPRTNSTTALRFQNAGGVATILTLDSTNMRVGVGDVGNAIETRFEVGGTASAANLLTTGSLQVAGGASVAYSRFGTGTAKQTFISATSDLLISGDLEILGTASFAKGASISLGPLNVGTASLATTTITFDSISATQGACIKIKDNDGSGYTYLRVANGVGTFSVNDCTIDP